MVLQQLGQSEVRIGEPTVLGEELKVPVVLNAAGGEAGVGFSLRFNPEILSFRGAVVGTDAASATLDVNSYSASVGRVGFALAVPNGFTFGPGTKQLLTLSFAVVSGGGKAWSFTFTDDPIIRDVASGDAESLPTVYSGVNVDTGSVAPSITYTSSNGGVLLSWPSVDSGYQLEYADSLAPGAWRPVAAAPLLLGDRFHYTPPTGQAQAYFRLTKP